jgi:hypothetical protein
LVDFWWKIFSSKTASPNEVNLGRQHTICPLPTVLCTIVVSDILYIWLLHHAELMYDWSSASLVLCGL